MELWLDTIDIPAIHHAKEIGLLFGLTTNPSILSKSDKPVEEVLEEISNVFSGPIAVQVTLRTAQEMVEQAKDLIDFSQKIIVKIPATPEGIQAISKLSYLGIPTMATTILEPLQGFFAAQAGASYLAPYFAHMGDGAMHLCRSIQHMCDVHKFPTKLLIAALRSKEQVLVCVEEGFAAMTLVPSLFRECLETSYEVKKHLERFESDWKKAPFSNLLASKQLIS